MKKVTALILVLGMFITSIQIYGELPGRDYITDLIEAIENGSSGFVYSDRKFNEIISETGAEYAELVVKDDYPEVSSSYSMLKLHCFEDEKTAKDNLSVIKDEVMSYLTYYDDVNAQFNDYVETDGTIVSAWIKHEKYAYAVWQVDNVVIRGYFTEADKIKNTVNFINASVRMVPYGSTTSEDPIIEPVDEDVSINIDVIGGYEGLVADGRNALELSISAEGDATGNLKLPNTSAGYFMNAIGLPISEITISSTPKNILFRPYPYIVEGELTNLISKDGIHLTDLWGMPVNLGFRFDHDNNASTADKTIDLEVQILNPPVVLIHGFTDNRSCWRYLESVLVDKKYACNRGDYFNEGQAADDITDLAEILSDNVENIDEELEAFSIKPGQVDLVGHSMGGLISRYYISEMAYESEDHVRKLIMVGTPNHGSSFLDVMLGHLGVAASNTHHNAVLDLYEDSDFIRQLNEGEAKGEHLNNMVQYGILYGNQSAYMGDSDMVVTSTSARLMGVTSIAFEGYVHADVLSGSGPSLTSDSKIHNQIVSWLENDIPRGDEEYVKIKPYEWSGDVSIRTLDKDGNPITVSLDEYEGSEVYCYDDLIIGSDGSLVLVIEAFSKSFGTVELGPNTKMHFIGANTNKIEVNMDYGDAVFITKSGENKHFMVKSQYDQTYQLVEGLDTAFSVNVKDGVMTTVMLEGEAVGSQFIGPNQGEKTYYEEGETYVMNVETIVDSDAISNGDGGQTNPSGIENTFYLDDVLIEYSEEYMEGSGQLIDGEYVFEGGYLLLTTYDAFEFIGKTVYHSFTASSGGDQVYFSGLTDGIETGILSYAKGVDYHDDEVIPDDENAIFHRGNRLYTRTTFYDRYVEVVIAQNNYDDMGGTVIKRKTVEYTDMINGDDIDADHYYGFTMESNQSDATIILHEFVIIDNDDRTGFNEDDLMMATGSSWALAEIEKAHKNGLTSDMTTDDFGTYITREEFCEIVLQFYAALDGRIYGTTGVSSHFVDTENMKIRAANALGIVNGTGNSKFSPKDTLTREQLCTMIVNALEALGYSGAMSQDTQYQQAYTDAHMVSSWAQEAVLVMNSRQILNGTGSGLAPQGTVTKEMALLMLNRAYEAFKAEEKDDMVLVYHKPVY